MKKLLTLVTASLFVLTANAQDRTSHVCNTSDYEVVLYSLKTEYPSIYIGHNDGSSTFVEAGPGQPVYFSSDAENNYVRFVDEDDNNVSYVVNSINTVYASHNLFEIYKGDKLVKSYECGNGSSWLFEEIVPNKTLTEDTLKNYMIFAK